MVKKFRGTYSVMVTPFNKEGGINELVLRQYVEWQIEQGIHGLIPLGSTGEFLSMTEEERCLVAETVVDQAAGRVPVLIGTGAEWSEDVIRGTLFAEKIGADGVMIIPPFYSTPTDDEIFTHYKTIAQKTNLPIMLYNNPATANVDLTAPLVARLSEIDNISYIKESTMDVTRIRDILDLSGDRMTVFGGIMGFESFLADAEGWVAVGSNIMPKEFSEIFTLTKDTQDLEKARLLYKQILPIIRLVAGHHYVSKSKASLELLGFSVGDPRSPRHALCEEDFAIARAALEKAGISL